MDKEKLVIHGDALYSYPRMQIYLDLTKEEDIAFVEDLRRRLDLDSASKAVLYLIRRTREVNENGR